MPACQPPPAGLISAAPGKRNSTLQNSARQVEQMVRMKMEQKEYIILCLEDSNDWSNATTRRLVMQARQLLRARWGLLCPAGLRQLRRAVAGPGMLWGCSCTGGGEPFARVWGRRAAEPLLQPRTPCHCS